MHPDLFATSTPAASELIKAAPIAVDLFAGMGGFTEGANLAGIEVRWAANHWPDAVSVHALNHPEVAHACQDLQQADWRDIPAHDLLMASPACQGHSPARGKERPSHDATRSTAWAVVSALEYHRPSVAVIENVEEFAAWTLFPAWCSAMGALGYTLSPHVLDAADAGVPQHRVRVFIIATRSKFPLKLALPRRDHVAIETVLDFNARDEAWTMVEKPGRAQATLDRVKSGRAKFGERFVMPFYGNGSGLTGRSISRPVGTITTRDRWAVVDGERMRMMSKEETRAGMGFRDSYALPKNHKQAIFMLGNAVCPPLAADVLGSLVTHH